MHEGWDRDDRTVMAITCANCGFVYYPPIERCPRCGADPRWTAHPNRMGQGAGYQGSAPEAPHIAPEHRPKNIDGFGYSLLRMGAIICLAGLAICMFFPDVVLWVAMKIDPEVGANWANIIRWGMAAFFAYGLIHSVFSIMSWRSGRYWYRNYDR
jgi:hypothetical protein